MACSILAPIIGTITPRCALSSLGLFNFLALQLFNSSAPVLFRPSLSRLLYSTIRPAQALATTQISRNGRAL